MVYCLQRIDVIHRNTSDGMERINVTRIVYEITNLRRDPNYIHYYINWFSLLSTGLIPVGLLIFLNGSIYAKIAETSRLRERCKVKLIGAHDPSRVPVPTIVMTGPRGPTEEVPLNTISATRATAGKTHHSPMNVSSKDFKMAMVMIAIVLVFFVCHLPRY